MQKGDRKITENTGKKPEKCIFLGYKLKKISRGGGSLGIRLRGFRFGNFFSSQN